MKRYGQIIGVKDETLNEYKKNHAAVWPGVLAKITECNICKYSIFYKNGLLFPISNMWVTILKPTWQKWLPTLPLRSDGKLWTPCSNRSKTESPASGAQIWKWFFTWIKKISLRFTD